MAAAPDDDARRTLAELEAKLRELERELLRGHEPDPLAAEPPPEAEPLAAEPLAAEPPPEAQPLAAEPPPAPEPLAAEPPPEPEPLAAEPAAPAPLAAEPPPEPEPLAAEPAAPAPLAAEPAPVAPVPFDPEPLAPAPEPAPPADAAGTWHVPGIPEPGPEAVQPEEPEPEPVPVLDLDALDDAHELVSNLRATVAALGVTAERVTAEARAVVDEHGRTVGRLERAAHAASRAEQAAVEAGRLAATVVVEAGPFADAGAVVALRDTLAAQPGARDAYVRGVEDGRAVIEVHLAPPPA
jgi:hypothetical protein